MLRSGLRLKGLRHGKHSEPKRGCRCPARVQAEFCEQLYACLLMRKPMVRTSGVVGDATCKLLTSEMKRGATQVLHATLVYPFSETNV